MRMSMNTTLRGIGLADDNKGHPQDEIRGQRKLVKVTEDVRKHAAKQGISESEAIKSGMQEKRKESAERDAEI